MKKFLSIFFLILCAVAAAAQSRYISSSPMEDEDSFADLGGAGGVMLLSKNGNLSINVTNAPKAKIVPRGARRDGYYEYAVIVDRNETSEPKIEVNRRGDINRTNFVVTTRPDFYRAYLIEEVERPIHMENQTAPNDAYLDPSAAELEFTTAIAGLSVKSHPSLGATVETKAKTGDREISITSVKIPIDRIDAARQRMETAQKAYNALNKRLVDDAPSTGYTPTDSDWETLDKLSEQADDATRDFQKLTAIEIFADGTNRLSVDISDLRPRMKRVYGVLLLNKVEKVYVTESSAALAEGSRLYALRDYANARANFEKALKAPDVRPDDKAMISSNIAECDTCIKYEQQLRPVLLKMNEMRKTGGSQAEVVRYATHAIGGFTTLNNYNPNDFYTGRIKRLNEIIEDQPLDIHFTVSKWVNDYSGFFESGRIPNVEVWEFTGDTPPAPKAYRTEKDFRKLVGSSSDYKLVGVTDEKGEIDVHLSRKPGQMPTGLIFRPVRLNDNVGTKYLDIREVVDGATGDYNKRQFRLKMYTRTNK